ncbi:MAG: hypothetical protein L0027_01520, partial [Candidatus Rokubacteria bacterium]|nr:hypothetical protein [Candidatus Rokubacteria bacterium]
REATDHPPKPIWSDLMATHPEIRERLRTSATMFERKLWREDLERWERETKPAAIREQLEVQGVDPSSLSGEALLAHLERTRENAKRQLYVHHLFNMPALLPVGDFLAHAQEWTGRPPTELLGLLKGASPVSLGAADELARLSGAIGRHPRAQAILFSSEPPEEVLASLRAMPGDVGAATSAYLDLVGYRLVNVEDVGEPFTLEMPDILVKTIRCAVEDTGASRDDDALARNTEAVRDAVPAAHRPAFDELLVEARAMHRLRDERGIYCDLWAYGIARRAMLAAGRRLAEKGRIAEPAHFVEAGYAEMRALVEGNGGPAAEELAERGRYRSVANLAEVPPALGPPPGDPLPLEWLPPAAARLERAIRVYIGAMFFAPQARHEGRTVRGLPVSPGTYEGAARLVRGTGDFARIHRGDVLVTGSTTAAFNCVLPLLGAIVTDRGGLLSHAAIVAREYGIPAVVGCTDATRRIPDSSRVRVDGGAGEAVVVS